MEPEQVEAILNELAAPTPSPEFKRAIMEQARLRMSLPTKDSPALAPRILVLAAALFFSCLVGWFVATPPDAVSPGAQGKGEASGPGALSEHIKRFADGDDSERQAILKGGAPGVLLLRQSRDQAPGRIDDLLFELKKQIAGPQGAQAALALEKKRTLKIPRGLEHPLWYAFDELKEEQHVPLFLDPVLLRLKLGDEKTSLEMVDRSGREILDALCLNMGLDYGFFYGRVLISIPERLWPAVPGRTGVALGKAEAERARQWVEDLGHEKPDLRVTASEGLRKLGGTVLPILEQNATRPETEIAVQCRELIALLSSGRQGLFGRPGAERQNLQGDDAAFYKLVKERPVSFKCGGVPLEGCLRLLLGPMGIPVEISPAAKQVPVMVDAQNDSLWVILAVLCQGNGFDYVVRDGKLCVEAKEEIEKQLRAGR